MDNPYDPPRSRRPGPDDDDGVEFVPMPTAVTVFGILGLIYGGLGLACEPAIAYLNSQAVAQPQAESPLVRIVTSAEYRAGFIALAALAAVASGLLLVASLGLLLKRPWGRMLAVAYGIGDLALVAANIIFSTIYVFIPMLRVAREAPNPQASGFAVGAAIGATGVNIAFLLFPALLLIFMTRPRVVAAFDSRRAGAAAYE